MDILAIESSTTQGSLALWRDTRPVDVRGFKSDRAHNSVLFKPLAELLGQVEQLELIVVGTGPGSYTGIRVGIAAGMGISLAWGVPMVGIPGICALGHALGEEAYAVCGDARRGAWWWAVVKRGVMENIPVVGTQDKITALASLWPGGIFTPDVTSPPFCRATPSTIHAEILAMRAQALSEAAVQNLAAEAVEPIYLRSPFVTDSKQPVFIGGSIL